MRKAWMAAALMGLGLGCAASAAWADEPVLEVDLGGQATDTPTPAPTATPLPPTPTAAPTAVALPLSATAELDLVPSPTPTPLEDLKKPRFDKALPEEDGLMIIAPGAASPEDSLESFGIESPFNWKDRQNRILHPDKDGGAAEGQGADELELSAPDSSDLKERVSVENGEGEAQPSDQDYDRVERVGGVLNAGEYRVDGRVDRNKNGEIFAREGVQAALRMEPGRQVYPGSVYTVFREGGVLSTSGEDSHEVGLLINNVGVLRVTRIEGDEVLARVEKQYDAIREGDLVRLRDPERMKYYAALRQGPGTPPLELTGEVIGLSPLAMMANRGDVVYLDLGRAKGVTPGMRLLISRGAEELGVDGIRELKGTGRIGVVQVINTTRDACVARVVQCQGEVRLGDKVRYR